MGGPPFAGKLQIPPPIVIPPLKVASPLFHARFPPIQNPEKFSTPIHFSERGGESFPPPLILTQGKPWCVCESLCVCECRCGLLWVFK